MTLINKLKQRGRKLKAKAQVLFIAYKDRRTPLSAKILIGITIGYLLSPIDLIPDFILVLGLLDDLIIVPALIALSLKLIPTPVMFEARERYKQNLQHYKKNNWIVAGIIILLWFLLLFFLLRRFHFFQL